MKLTSKLWSKITEEGAEVKRLTEIEYTSLPIVNGEKMVLVQDNAYVCTNCGSYGNIGANTECPCCGNSNFTVKPSYGYSVNERDNRGYFVYIGKFNDIDVWTDICHYTYITTNYGITTRHQIVYILRDSKEVRVISDDKKKITTHYLSRNAKYSFWEYSASTLKAVNITFFKNASSISAISSEVFSNEIVTEDVPYAWNRGQYVLSDMECNNLDIHYVSKYLRSEIHPYSRNVYECPLCGKEIYSTSKGSSLGIYDYPTHCFNCDGDFKEREGNEIHVIEAEVIGDNLAIRETIFNVKCHYRDTYDIQYQFSLICMVSPEGKVTFYNDIQNKANNSEIFRNINKSRIYMLHDETVIIGFPAIKRTGLAEWIKAGKCNIIQFLSIYSFFPEIEMLSKRGAMSLLNRIIEEQSGYKKRGGFDPKCFRKKSFKLTANVMKQLKSDFAGYLDTEIITDVLSRDSDAQLEDVYPISGGYRLIKDIMRMQIPNMKMHDIKKYIDYVYEFQCCERNEALQLWSDYIRMLKQLECDLTDKRLIYTNSLKREHDKAMRKIGLLRNTSNVEEFKQIVESEEYKKYCYIGPKYIVTVPKSPEDMFEEGRKLNHCVGSYVERVINGECIILFVRKANSPDKAYFTVEIADNAICQARGYSQSLPGADVRQFLKSYAKYHNIRCKI